jgi:hypothetical protein
MIGLIGVVGGAAALEIRRMRRGGDDAEQQQQLKDLKKAVEVRGVGEGGQELYVCRSISLVLTVIPPPKQPQQRAKDLEKERRAAQAASTRVDSLQSERAGLLRDAGELQQAAERLARQREQLLEENAALQMSNMTLEERAARLQGEAHDLAAVNRRLAEQVGGGALCPADGRLVALPAHRRLKPENPRQVDELSAGRDADGSRLAADLAALRDSVAAVLQRFFSSEVSPEEAVQALRDLGCEVKYSPGKAARARSFGRRAAASNSR